MDDLMQMLRALAEQSRRTESQGYIRRDDFAPATPMPPEPRSDDPMNILRQLTASQPDPRALLKDVQMQTATPSALEEYRRQQLAAQQYMMQLMQGRQGR